MFHPNVKRQHVAVCIPHMDMVYARFWISMQSLRSETAQWTFHPLCASVISLARNILVKQALEVDATHLLFIDSDQTFPSNLIDRLLSWDKDIVGATCPTKTTHRVVCLEHAVEKDAFQKERLVEMNRLGTGILMIKTSVFAKLKKPYFRFDFIEECPEHPDGIETGEDIGFCDRARAAGFRIWCDRDLSLEIGHVGNEAYVIKDFETKTAL